MDRAELSRRAESGETFKYVFFWGHTPSTDGSINASCFSQWFDAPFVVDDVNYPTAEHYMMAEKARLFGDDTTLSKIIAADSPGAAKALGRSVQRFDGAQWDAHRFDIVVRGNVAKFSQHDAMRSFLVGTGERVLVEASPRDRIWGIGLGAANERAQDPRTWRGENLLGFALMAVREQLGA